MSAGPKQNEADYFQLNAYEKIIALNLDEEKTKQAIDLIMWAFGEGARVGEKNDI